MKSQSASGMSVLGFAALVLSLTNIGILGQDLVLHHSLGSMPEIAVPNVGPSMSWPTPPGGFLYTEGTPEFVPGLDGGAVMLGEQAQSGSYWSGSRNRLFRLSNATGVINADHGTVECVFRVLSVPGSSTPFWNFLHLVDGPYEEDPNSKFLLSVGGFLEPSGTYSGMRVYFSIRRDDVPLTGVEPISILDGIKGASILGSLHSWIQVTAMWDRAGIFGSSDTMRLYINGELHARTTGVGWSGVLGPHFDVGGSAGLAQGQYAIDDLKIWEGARLPTARPLSLQFHRSLVPGGVVMSESFASPRRPGFTALSLDPQNQEPLPGSGWFFGLHISMADLVAQWTYGGVPFRFLFDDIGTSHTVLSPFQVLPLRGFMVHGVAVSLDPIGGGIQQASGRTSFVVP